MVAILDEWLQYLMCDNKVVFPAEAVSVGRKQL
jgi:hypothetical protein